MIAFVLAIVWQPAGSSLHILAAVVFLAALAVFAYAHVFMRAPTASLGLLLVRLVVIAVVAVLLMGPSRLGEQIPQQRRPKLTVLLDTSASMLTEDMQSKSRFAYALDHWLEGGQLNELARNYDIELVGFDQTLRPLSQTMLQRDAEGVATGRASEITQCVTNAILRSPQASQGSTMLLVSDGRDTQDRPLGSASSLARARGLSIHTVCLGGQTLQRDLAVHAVPAQEYLYANEPGQIFVRVHQVGLKEASATLRVRSGDQSRQIPIRFDQKHMVQVDVPVQHENAGLYEYILSVDPVEGETQTDNNTQRFFCRVTKQPISVLMLEGAPFWDTKFLAQALRRDERIELTQITQIASQKTETIVTRVGINKVDVPRSIDQWSHYDIVVLGRSIENLLISEVAMQLPQYVSRGGHVILARSQPYNPDTVHGRPMARVLKAIEPVIWGDGSIQNATLRPTPAGLSSPLFSMLRAPDRDETLAQLPAFTVRPLVEREKTATLVLARVVPHDAGGGAVTGPPALVKMTYGRGSVVAVLGEGLWRWRLGPESTRGWGVFYDTLWSNLVRWMVLGGEFEPGREMSLKLSRHTARRGDDVQIEVIDRTAANDTVRPVLNITDPSGQSHQLFMETRSGYDQHYRTHVTASSVGVYEVELRTSGLTPQIQRQKFSVYDFNREHVDSSANPMLLRQLAGNSGGEFFLPAEYERFVSVLERQRSMMLVPRRAVFIWDRGLILVLLLVWSGLEWILRRRRGLP